MEWAVVFHLGPLQRNLCLQALGTVSARQEVGSGWAWRQSLACPFLVAVPWTFSWEAGGLDDSLPWQGVGPAHNEQLARVGSGGRVCVCPWGPKQAEQGSGHALPDSAVLSRSFITFRSCAYLDKKHTIFGR